MDKVVTQTLCNYSFLYSAYIYIYIYIGRQGRNMTLAYVIHIESEGFRGTVAQSVLSYIPGLAGGVQASYM